MATAVIMPKQGQSVESCIITKWNKSVGDRVSVGDVLFSYETDKASFEEEAKAEGILLAVFFEEGDDVECLLNVCVIGDEGEDISSFAPAGREAAAPSEEAPGAGTAPAARPAASAAPAQTDSGDLKISPRAKNLAAQSGADLKKVTASGPNNRVIERDVLALLDAGHVVSPGARDDYAAISAPVAGSGLGGRIIAEDLLAKPVVSAPAAPVQGQELYEDIKTSNIRKIIAKSMHASLSQSAQLTLSSSFDATDILAFRKKLKEQSEALGLPNITINDMIIYAVSRALVAHPDMNSHYLGDTMRLFKTANVGVACDTPRGLMVPTLFGADTLSLSKIAEGSKGLTSAAKEGTISPDLLTGGTFTITNLGTLGIESFTPVLNPPQTGILGVCAITERSKNGAFYPAIGLSLTFDHRAIDGAPAARFLQDLVRRLENFSLTLSA